MTSHTKEPAFRPGPERVGNPAFVLFDELVASRDWLAGLPPLTRQDLEHAARAMHELVWYLLLPPKGRKTELALPKTAKAALLRAANDRSADLYTAIVACVAIKLAGAPGVAVSQAAVLDRLNENLDGLAFDFRRSKRASLALLRRVRKEVDERIRYVGEERPKAFRLNHAPETYRARANKAERPDAFFRRVYGPEVRRGLNQADIRRLDRGFYNVLHVWCTRHRKRLSSMLPASRARGH